MSTNTGHPDRDRPPGTKRLPAREIRLLGGVRVSTKEGELPISPLQTSLLLLVYSHQGVGIGRRRVCDLLWGTGTESSRRRRLSQLLHSIKDRLGVDAFRAIGDNLYPADPDAVSCDLTTFLSDEDAARRLAEFGLGDTYAPTAAFERWMEDAERRLRQQVAEARRPVFPTVLAGVTPHEVTPERESIEPRTSESLAWPFRGRSAEVGQVLDILSGRGGQPNVVTVSGPSGIGKSRMLKEVLPRLGEQVDVSFVRLAQFESRIALSTVARLFETEPLRRSLDGLEPPWGPALAEALGCGCYREPLETTASIRPAAVHLRVAEAVRIAVTQVAEESGLVLAIDDAQWLDPSSHGVLEYLARRVDATGLSMLFSVNTDSLPNDVPMPMLGRSGRPVLIPLQPLSDTAIHGILTSLGLGIEGDDLARLARAAEGNPLCLRELVRLEFDGGPGSEVTAIRRMASLRRLIRSRLERIDTVAREIVDVLAAYGKPVNEGRLALLTGLRSEALGVPLATLCSIGLVQVNDGIAELQHDVMGDVVLSECSTMRRCELHSRIANQLSTEVGTPPAEVAEHAARAGLRTLAVSSGLAAADAAESVGGFSEAASYLDLARREALCTAEADSYAPRLGRLYLQAGDYPRSIRFLDRALGSASPEDARMLAAERLQALYYGRLERRSILSMEVSELINEAEASQDWKAMVASLDLALHILAEGGPLNQLQRTLERLEAPLRHGDPTTRCQAGALKSLYQICGQSDRALRAIREALQLAKTHQLRVQELRCYNNLLAVLHFRGELALNHGRQVITEAWKAADQSGDLRYVAMIKHNIAAFLADTGDVERALAVLRGVDMSSALADLQPVGARLHCTLAHAHFEVGNIAESLAASERIREGAALIPWLALEAEAAIGLCHMQQGRLVAAQRNEEALEDGLRDIAPTCSDLGQVPVFLAEMAFLSGDWQQAVDIIDQFRSLAESVQNPYWLRLTRVRARFFTRAGRQPPVDELEAATDLARALGLRTMERRLAAALSQYSSHPHRLRI